MFNLQNTFEGDIFVDITRPISSVVLLKQNETSKECSEICLVIRTNNPNNAICTKFSETRPPVFSFSFDSDNSVLLNFICDSKRQTV